MNNDYKTIGYGFMNEEPDYGSSPNMRGHLTLTLEGRDPIALPIAGWWRDNDYGRYLSLSSSMKVAKAAQLNERDIPAEVLEELCRD